MAVAFFGWMGEEKVLDTVLAIFPNFGCWGEPSSTLPFCWGWPWLVTCCCCLRS